MHYLLMGGLIIKSFLNKKTSKSRMIIIKNLGVQLESQTLGGSISKKFIDISRVRDIVINEVSFIFVLNSFSILHTSMLGSI